MSKFIASVTLFEASAADYAKLSEELGKKLYAFSQKKTGDTKEASFTKSGNVGIREVTDDVLRAATRTGKKYAFTIIRNKPVGDKELRLI